MLSVRVRSSDGEEEIIRSPSPLSQSDGGVFEKGGGVVYISRAFGQYFLYKN